jgi:hypothetical protein
MQHLGGPWIRIAVAIPLLAGCSGSSTPYVPEVPRFARHRCAVCRERPNLLDEPLALLRRLDVVRLKRLLEQRELFT